MAPSPKLPARLAAAFLGLALAVPAVRAADSVYWSVGISPAPGVAVTAGNAPPPRVVYAPQPVHVSPVTPVYAVPQVVYTPPPVVYTPPRVVYAPAPSYYYVQPVTVLAPPARWPHGHPGHPGHHGHSRGHGHGYGHGHGHGHDGRYRY